MSGTGFDTERYVKTQIDAALAQAAEARINLNAAKIRIEELEAENANLHELFKELATIKDSEIIRAIVEKRALAAAEKR